LGAEGRVLRADVYGWEAPAFISSADLPLLHEVERGSHEPAVTTFLSPFDNLIWERRRTQRLFDFTYKTEIYTPVVARKDGYYVLPILHRGHLVGRMDPKVDRQHGILVLHRIWFEPGVIVSEDMLNGIAGALREFMFFHNCSTLLIKNSKPTSLKAALSKRVH
jgi:uncharacterized protein YcaQ